MSDVLLLCDVLERYRKMCWDRMKLEPLHYVSLPALTFDACLKLTKTKLEIVKDIDMLQMIETGIRGWIFNFITFQSLLSNELVHKCGYNLIYLFSYYFLIFI